MYKLSPSSLSLMEDCPRCFWLDKHKVWKRPETIFPSLPGGIDRVLKAHFDRHREKNEVPGELSVLKDSVKLFGDKDKMKIWQANFKGISYTDSRGNILHGAVDEILQKGKKLIVMDFKTRGAPCKDDTHTHYVNQLNVYNFLLRKNGYATEDYSYLLFFHPREVTETGTVVFNIEPVKIPVNVGSAEKLWKSALRCLNGTCPKKACDWCEKV